MSLLVTTIRDTFFSLMLCCFPNPTIYINKRKFKVINLIGEGKNSFVYLIKDESSHEVHALKKVCCPAGETIAVTEVMHEIEMYRQFQSEYIIKVLDTSILTERDSSRIVYIFLPYYKRGNLQDNINANNLNKTFFPEKDLVDFFLKVCYALRILHTYKLPYIPSSLEEEHNDSDESLHVPYAHRDLKPGNILISDDGKTPILMDFGSVTKARIPINTRQDGLLQQDIASEQSTMPYRAPELFDVQTGSVLDEKVDIWSLGCTLYTAAYGQNPFEASVNEMGGSIALAILNGQFKFPEEDPYSDKFKNFIKSLLVIDPKERLDIHKVIEKLESGGTTL